MWQKIKEFWVKYETKVVLVLGFILVAAISFEAGILKGREMPQNPLIIEKTAQLQEVQENAAQAQNLGSSGDISSASANQSGTASEQKCAFVGSKNSNKYHLPTCRYAKNISPENLVCFSSADEAKSKGYLPDKNCIK